MLHARILAAANVRRAASFILIIFCLSLSLAAQAQFSLTSTLAGGATGDGNMFEVKALNAVRINDFDVHLLSGPGGSFEYEIYALNQLGSYVGFQTSGANWTLIARTSQPSGILTNGIPTPLNLSLDFPIPAGQIQSFYVRCTNGFLNDSAGTTGTIVSSDTNLEIYAGHGEPAGIPNGFAATVPNKTWNGTIYYSNYTTQTDDMAVRSVLSPTNSELDCNPNSSSAAVTVEVSNEGLNPIPIGTIVPISFSVDGGPLTTEFLSLTAPLLTGNAIPFTFAATADVSALGNHQVFTSVGYALDLDTSNDNLTVQIGSGGNVRVSIYPYVESFEFPPNPFGLPNTSNPIPPLGFVQETTDGSGLGSNWRFTSSPTPTGGTGPIADHTTGIPDMGGYAFLEDDGDQATVNLRSPCLDFGGILNPRLRFFMSSNNIGTPADETFLSIDVIDQTTGVVTTDFWGPTGDLGTTQWIMQEVDLSPFVGQVVQLVFRGNTTGTSFSHDIAIDDFSVFDNVPTLGQAPQPGLATFQLNDARNAHGAPLSFGFNGPYFTQVTQGDVLHFEISGEPLRPIIMFAGPLNPAVASFAGIGTIDCGTTVGMNGLPNGLVVVGDGNLTDGVNPFFVTTAAGFSNLGFTVPNLPLGPLATFQTALITSVGSGVSLSNAVEVTIF